MLAALGRDGAAGRCAICSSPALRPSQREQQMRPTSIGPERRPCYAWPTVTRARLRESNSNEEDLVLRTKCMNLDALMGSGG